MTNQLDSRETGTVAAYMDETDHPIGRSTFTPAEGLTIDAEPASAAEPARGFPLPPERGSLDDEDLVPLVGRHTEDTATVDLIGILQAQMHLRQVEAARFASWEAEIRRIGTKEALDELERTRLHFTGVIPVQVPATTFTPTEAPAGSALVAEPLPAKTSPSELPVIVAGTAPRTAPSPDAPINVHAERARVADDELLEKADEVTAVPSHAAPRWSPRAVVVTTVSALAVVVVVVAILLSPLGAPAVAVASVAAFGALAAAWLGVALAQVVRPAPRGGLFEAVSDRTAWAVMAAIVVGTAVGEGVIRAGTRGFGWQGYLVAGLPAASFPTEASIVVGLAAGLVVGAAVVILAGLLPVAWSFRSASGQDRAAD